ncbi:GIN domain-containing protein [Qipengyuania sp.]|uniref:GIN domain-containing protein n=1 Tax=Qipengyuania sp. TaxID=2004515 RepID=UPI003AF57F63
MAFSAAGAVGDQGWKISSYQGDETQILGSGRMVSQNRPIGSFDTLSIDGPVDVVIRQGAARSLVLTAEDNIMPLVRARTEGGTLSLDTTGSFRSRRGVSAVLTVSSLDKVTINASGDVRFDGWNAERIELVIGGSGDIELGGEVANVRALIQGSGDIDLAPTRLSYVDADIEGSGAIRMGSLRKLDASIDGSGMIEAGVVGELDAVLNGSGQILYRSADRILREERNGSGRIARH